MMLLFLKCSLFYDFLYCAFSCVDIKSLIIIVQEIDPELIDQDKIVNEDLGDDDSKLKHKHYLLRHKHVAQSS